MNEEINSEPVVPVTPVPTEPEIEETPPEETTEPESVETEEEKQSGFERRVQKLTQKAKDAEQEAQYWRQHVTQSTPAPQQQAEKKPIFSDYNDLETYTEAVSNWTADRAVKQALVQAETERSGRTVLDTYNRKVEEFKRETPDFDAVFADLDDVKLDPDIVQAIMEAEKGPALAYHLAKNLSEVRKLNNQSPYQRLMSLGKLEASLTKPSGNGVKKISSSPAGQKTPNPSTTSTKALEDMSPSEFIAHRNRTVGRR